jgi:shikimate dehydrogenase
MLGANVTIPHKIAARAFIDECDPLAARVGAINTIVNHDGRLTGYNTDVGGFMQALGANKDRPFQSEGKSATIIGTGGAARAAAFGLLDGGIAELTLLGRTPAHLAALLQQLQASAAPSSDSSARLQTVLLGSPDASRFLAGADLLVNATPVGLHEEDARLLVDVRQLSPTALVMDMIFNPPCTPLLRAAQARGCAVMNGLTMLLYQGALAFELWTGQTAPIDAMQQALGLS